MPPRSRTKENVQFGVQVENVSSEKIASTLAEDGALIESENKYYAGVQGQWRQFAPIDNSALDTGWARYDDGQYVGENTYNFTTAPFTVQNDGAVKIDNYALSMYGVNEFTLQENATYCITIYFKGYLNTSNGHIEIYLNCPTDPDYSNIADVLIFPKGNGVEHKFCKTFHLYANENAASDGLVLKFNPSHSGSLYDVIYFIEKISNG
jgi:hypothetical protein